MTEKVEKEHFLQTIKGIRKALDDIEEDIIDDSYTSYKWQMITLLCRTGELELCINLNNTLKKDPNAVHDPNRLCKCYDESECVEY